MFHIFFSVTPNLASVVPCNHYHPSNHHRPPPPYSNHLHTLTTRLANPHFLPEMCIKVSLLNFSITHRGLEDQLLVDVVKNERPELESRRDQLVLSIATDQSELSKLEDEILGLLANASGNILEDEKLINTLQKSKETSTNVTLRVAESVKVAAEVSVAREAYRSVATRGSVLYFCVSMLAETDPI